MRWTALARSGGLARTEDYSAKLEGFGQYPAGGYTYVPVYAIDPQRTSSLLLFRDGQTDEVKILSSRGQTSTLGSTIGKWPLAIVALGQNAYLCAWISGAITNVAMARVVVGDTLQVTMEAPQPIEPAMVLIDMNAAGGLTLDNTDRGYEFREITRAGLTVRSIYSHEVNGRIVVSDGREGAPNQVLLADFDGWYLVDDQPDSTLFPPRVDALGNVATFEGKYFTIANIRTRPIAVDPNPPPPPPPPAGPSIVTFGDTSALGPIASIPPELLIGGAIVGLAIIIARKD
jgi:hypothetical protein